MSRLTQRQKTINKMRARQNGTDPFDVIERHGKKIAVGFIVFWIACALVSLGLIGVVIWAIIHLVSAV